MLTDAFSFVVSNVALSVETSNTLFKPVTLTNFFAILNYYQKFFINFINYKSSHSDFEDSSSLELSGITT